jgi:hypothetical protein
VSSLLFQLMSPAKRACWLTLDKVCDSVLGSSGLLGTNLGLTDCATACPGTGNQEACGSTAISLILRMSIYNYVVSPFPCVCVPSSVVHVFSFVCSSTAAHWRSGARRGSIEVQRQHTGGGSREKMSTKYAGWTCNSLVQVKMINNKFNSTAFLTEVYNKSS